MSNPKHCPQPQAHPERCGCSIVEPIQNRRHLNFLIQDRRHLDFLIEEEARVVRIHASGKIRYCVEWPRGVMTERQREAFTTPRAAIDAAMEALKRARTTMPQAGANPEPLCSFCLQAGCNGECSGDGATGD